MKALLFSDLHCDLDLAESLVEQSQEVDFVVGAGDFASQRKGLEKTIQALSGIECPALLVPGNGESYEELQEACGDWESAVVLHGSHARRRGLDFFGIGGAIPETDLGAWSYDLSETEARLLLRQFVKGSILISHSPPKGILDSPSSGGHLGSQAVREAIEQHHPPLVICGHVHENWEQTASLGATTIVNAGPRGKVWEFQE